MPQKNELAILATIDIDTVIKKIRQLIGGVDDIPKSVDTKIEVDTEKAELDLNAVEAAKKQVDKDVDVKVDADVGGAEGEINGLSDDIVGLKEVAVGAAASIATIGVAGGFEEQSKSLGKVKAATGDWNSELETSTNKIYAITGADWDQVTEATIFLKNSQGLLGTELEKSASKAINFVNIFDEDMEKTIRANSNLIQNFGVNGEQAFDIMTATMQATGDSADDLLDTFIEYSPHFNAIGFDAVDMGNMITSATKRGIRDTDYFADAVKEFGIRVSSASDQAKAGFDAIGASAGQQKKWIAAIKEGGPAAKQATTEIVQALMKIEDPIKRYNAGVELFGTKWEDARDVIGEAILDSNNYLGDFNGAMDKASSASGGFVSSIEKAFRGISPILGGALDTIQDFGAEIAMTFGTVIGMAFVSGGGQISTSIATITTAFSNLKWSVASSASQLLLWASTGPGIAVIAALALAAALIYLGNQYGWFKSEIDKSNEALNRGKQAMENAKKAQQEAQGEVDKWTKKVAAAKPGTDEYTKANTNLTNAKNKLTTATNNAKDAEDGYNKATGKHKEVLDNYNNAIEEARKQTIAYKVAIGELTPEEGKAATEQAEWASELSESEQKMVDTTNRLNNEFTPAMKAAAESADPTPFNETVSSFADLSFEIGKASNWWEILTATVNSSFITDPMGGLREGLRSLYCWIVGCSPGVIPAFGQLVGTITGLPGRIAAGLTKFVEDVKKWGSDTINNAKKTGQDFVKYITDSIRSLPGSVWKYLLDTLGKITSFGSDGKNRGRNAGQSIIDGVINKVKGLPGELWKWGSQGISSFVSGIKSKFPDILGALDWIRSHLPNSPPKTGPLSKVTTKTWKNWTKSLVEAGNEGLEGFSVNPSDVVDVPNISALTRSGQLNINANAPTQINLNFNATVDLKNAPETVDNQQVSNMTTESMKEFMLSREGQNIINKSLEQGFVNEKRNSGG